MVFAINLLLFALVMIFKNSFKLKNYEEEIKAYGIERKSLLDRIEQLEYELNGVNSQIHYIN